MHQVGSYPRALLGFSLLALAIAASLAVAAQAQDFQPPDSTATESVLPSYTPLPARPPGPDAPPPLFGPPPSNTGLPPAPPAFPQTAPGTAMPGPAFSGRGSDAGPPGDMMGFGGSEGRGGMAGLGGGMFPADSVRYARIWFPTVPVRGQATNFQMVGQNLAFTHPLWVNPVNALSLSGGVNNRLIETDAILLDTGQPIPSDLWNVNLGLRYCRQLADGWLVGGGLSIGSASDHPFAGIREMYVGMNAMLIIPQGEHNAWMLSLMYSPAGELNFPVPGVAYNWNPAPSSTP